MAGRYRIAALPGEGIGPEIVDAALRVLDAAAGAAGIELATTHGPIGKPALAETGSYFPQETIDLCTESDGILLGGVERGGLLELRGHFDFFACLRPARALDCLLDTSSLQPERLRGTDILTVRELTSGLLFGEAGRGEDERGPYGYHTMLYTDAQIRRIGRVALAQAQRRRGRLCVAHKENALPQLPWTDLVLEEAKDFPDVEVESLHTDNLGMQMVLEPTRFDVIVTGNLMGDWLSSLAGSLVGSVGLLPSACLNPNGFGVFEGVHGMAPDIAGQGIANPLGTLLAGAMMVENWGEPALAARIRRAVEATLAKGFRTPELHPARPELRVGTEEMADRVIAELEAAGD